MRGRIHLGDFVVEKDVARAFVRAWGGSEEYRRETRQHLNTKALEEILWSEEHWSDNILGERGQSWGHMRGW